MNIKLALIIMILLCWKVVDAQTESEAVDESALVLEIDGLIIDDTTTKLGKDFYDIFYTNWQTPQNAKNFSVTISEKPLPRLGTQVTITINETQMFQSFLQPRYDVIEAIAFQAIGQSQEFLINYEAIQQQLQGDDLSGSGIF